MEAPATTTVLGSKPHPEKDNTCIDPAKHRGLFYLGVFIAAYPGGTDAALIATRRRHRMPELFTDDIDAAPSWRRRR